MIKKTYCLLMLFALICSMASCSKSNEPIIGPEIPNDALYDIVTLVATTANSSTFSVQKNENSAPATYFSSVSLLSNTDIKPGSRLLIAYKMQHDAPAYSTGAITLYGFSRLNNTEPDVLIGTSAAYNGWDTEPMKMLSMWLTGDYLNVHSQMFTTVTGRPTRYILVADQSTLDNPIIEVHLILKSNNSDGGNLSPIYASFDIYELLKITTCERIRVHYLDVSGFTYREFNNPGMSERPLD